MYSAQPELSGQPVLRAAACKDREFAVNDQILRIALILPKNPHW